MSITASIIESVSQQKDGLRYVTEAHTDHLGVVRRIVALRNGSIDDDAELAKHAAQMPSDLRQAEIAENIALILRDGAQAALTFNHSTASQMRTVLRETFRNATRQDAAFIGDFLNALTDAQLQTVFGMTAQQVTTLRNNRLVPSANIVASINSAVGA